MTMPPAEQGASLQYRAPPAGNLPGAILTAAVALGALALAAMSLRWGMYHDSPIMMYVAYLVQGAGYAPYRDVFDMNAPGAYVAYAVVGLATGYTDIGFRLADLALLAVTVWLTWHLLKPFGVLPATFGGAMWSLVYLRYGAFMSLQREVFVLVLILLALNLRSRGWGRRGQVGALASGVAWGMAGLVKPHALIGLVFLTASDAWGQRWKNPNGTAGEGRTGVHLAATAAGVLLPWGAAALWLAASGGLQSFVEIAAKYWPLYSTFPDESIPDSGWQRVRYLVSNIGTLGGHLGWVVAGALGLFRVLILHRASPVAERRAVELGTMALGFALYPVFAGFFFMYHWILFEYFALQLAALSLLSRVDTPAPERRYATALLALVVVLRFSNLPAQPQNALKAHPKEDRVLSIATFLRDHVGPDERVQPLDWTGGAVHAMLQARVLPATPFIYDFHFYHDVDKPYIGELRQRFIGLLEATPPAYVIRMTGEDKPWPSGEGTTRRFPALELFLQRQYVVARSGEGYQILRRTVPPVSRADE